MLKQPLLHFLIFGLVLFGVFEWVTHGWQSELNPRTIRVDREDLLTHLQYRSSAFNNEYFSRQLDAMTPDEKQQLIDELVREEVLFREALALELDQNDYVIKRRLIQKLEYLTKGFITVDSGLTNGKLQTYYEVNRLDYFVQPFVTFTHVFFDFSQRERQAAMIEAERILEQLNIEQVPFSEGLSYGDRFLYHTNYVERTGEYVASHFGASMAESIFKLSAGKEWQGPFKSPYGLHLVMLTWKEPGRFPTLEEIYDRVKDDAEREAVRQRTEQAIDEIIESYDIRIVLDN